MNKIKKLKIISISCTFLESLLEINKMLFFKPYAILRSPLILILLKLIVLLFSRLIGLNPHDDNKMNDASIDIIFNFFILFIWLHN